MASTPRLNSVVASSTRRAGVKASEDAQLATLLAADTPVLTLVGKTWTLHVTEISREGYGYGDWKLTITTDKPKSAEVTPIAEAA